VLLLLLLLFASHGCCLLLGGATCYALYNRHCSSYPTSLLMLPR
jgi:hypothetical protein